MKVWDPVPQTWGIDRLCCLAALKCWQQRVAQDEFLGWKLGQRGKQRVKKGLGWRGGLCALWLWPCKQEQHGPDKSHLFWGAWWYCHCGVLAEMTGGTRMEMLMKPGVVHIRGQGD